jgi:hypothetical protein
VGREGRKEGLEKWKEGEKEERQEGGDNCGGGGVCDGDGGGNETKIPRYEKVAS